MERHLKQQDRHSACVIAQRYFLAMCMMLRFHIAKKLSVCCEKLLLFEMYLFFKELRKTKIG
jgi:hypothetical protein